MNYKASAEPLEVVLSGGIGPKDDKQYLIGQRVGATLSTGGLTATSYNWSVSGGWPFKSYSATYDANNPTATYGRRTEMGAENNSSLQFHFGNPNNGTGTPTVTCTAHLAVPTGHSPAGGFNITQERECGVDKPLNELAVTIGSVHGVPFPPASSTALHFTSNTFTWSGTTYTTGIRWKGRVTTPAKFGSVGSPGWNYTQLIKPGRSFLNGDTGVTHKLDPDGVSVLDGKFGYSNHFPADGSEQNDGDDPACPFVGSPYTNLTIHESFVTYTLYRPPGDDSTFVPLKNLDWYWQGAASADESDEWTVSNTAAMWSFLEDFPRHPEWEGNVAPLTFSPPVP